MKDTTEQWLPVASALLIWLERMREVATARATVPGRREETLTLKVFILCGLIMVFGGIGEYFWRDLRVNWPLFGVGLAISISAFVIRRSAIRALGRFWSLHVEMREGHEFITSGPFRYVRHPAYFSMILEHVGMAVLLGAYFTFAIVMVLFVPTLWFRFRREEAALIRQLGPQYEEYRRRTPAIIPLP
jgi:protein-S-isoprenylcysteine O-methyltransferase Ste14